MKDEKNNISAGQVYGMFEEVKEMIEKRPRRMHPAARQRKTIRLS